MSQIILLYSTPLRILHLMTRAFKFSTKRLAQSPKVSVYYSDDRTNIFLYNRVYRIFWLLPNVNFSHVVVSDCAKYSLATVKYQILFEY